jgi:hypothetical protein
MRGGRIHAADGSTGGDNITQEEGFKVARRNMADETSDVVSRGSGGGYAAIEADRCQGAGGSRKAPGGPKRSPQRGQSRGAKSGRGSISSAYRQAYRLRRW